MSFSILYLGPVFATFRPTFRPIFISIESGPCCLRSLSYLYAAAAVAAADDEMLFGCLHLRDILPLFPLMAVVEEDLEEVTDLLEEELEVLEGD